MVSIKVALLQLNSRPGQIAANISTARSILSQLKDNTSSAPSSAKIDLLVLPELALTGYNYSSLNHIKPHLEPVGQGISYDFAKEVSAAYGCVTVIGYPEIDYAYPTEPVDNNINPEAMEMQQIHTDEKGATFKVFNSAMVVSPCGEVLHNYRKTHLYQTDKVWGASPSLEGFTSFRLEIPRLGKSLVTSLGICMDLNPWEFKSAFETYEFAHAVKEMQSELVIVPTAWMNSKFDENWTEQQQQEYSKCFRSPLGHEIDFDRPLSKSSWEYNSRILNEPPYPYPDMDPITPERFSKAMPQVDARTGQYWLMRLQPLWEQKANVVICNRSGMEGGNLYAGTSTMVSFLGPRERDENDNGAINMIVKGSLGMATEGLLLRNLYV